MLQIFIFACTHKLTPLRLNQIADDIEVSKEMLAFRKLLTSLDKDRAHATGGHGSHAPHKSGQKIVEISNLSKQNNSRVFILVNAKNEKMLQLSMTEKITLYQFYLNSNPW